MLTLPVTIGEPERSFFLKGLKLVRVEKALGTSTKRSTNYVFQFSRENRTQKWKFNFHLLMVCLENGKQEWKFEFRFFYLYVIGKQINNMKDV